MMANANRILIKLRPGVALAATEPRANLRPLYQSTPTTNAFGAAEAPSWYLADLPDSVGPNPWDLAHARVADQLGIDESAVLFAEPDLDQSFNDGSDPDPIGIPLDGAPDPCASFVKQDDTHRKVIGPDIFAWHLLDDFTQLGSARAAVQFSDPRTRIAHIDTGYYPNHVSRPEHIPFEHSFVEGDPDRDKAQARATINLLPQNLDHGTGTISILAGAKVPDSNDYLGGAPQAEIVPLRIANSVILFKTSAFVEALNFAIDHSCDVVSISMGGLPSRAWGEAVNRAYEAGVCICAAAGNNIVDLPSRHVVYPARYHRTIAVCGVMADGRPYYNIEHSALQGSWGPDSCMTAALASYTPNIPWAVYGCDTNIRRNGEGTSAATPQVAAAVALWYEKYKSFLPRDWHRVEAVRNALFTSAKAKGVDPQHFGNGILQANAALSIAPNLTLRQTPPDNDSFSFFRVITGLGLTETPPREEMFNLELTQRYLSNKSLQEIIPDPELPVSEADIRKFMDAVIQDDQASLALRKHIANRYPSVAGGPVLVAPPAVVAPPRAACNSKTTIPHPPFRRIRTYAVDPSFSTQLETASINEVTLKVRWEDLDPGPSGEYLQVVDVDAADVTYPPVDLDDPKLLAQDGCPPAEGNPAFHQQMVYAIAMKTIENFERALGRPVLWRPRANPDNPYDDSQFVRQLLVRPHALRQANAFYSPQEIALLFGYFEASADDPGDHVPGSMVYACLSHDIVAHETTHAILDGMYRRFNEPSNLDVLAFHEAFADIVALMQHFTIPEILENEISQTRGNLETESMLGSLALQFGRAVGGRGALREAIGKLDANGNWIRNRPDPADYKKVQAPHARGALLVAAVFDAFLAIYKTRTADLLRIYTGGTGVLPSGAIHPDLVRRLATEAAKAAGHVGNMCIRALDYLPPVDITFGEYLRGIITADADLVEDDRYNYRVAMVEAFRKRGIYPLGLDTLSVDTLRWQGVDLNIKGKQAKILINQLKHYADKCFYISSRETLFKETRIQRIQLHAALQKILAEIPELAPKLGLAPNADFEVHALRRSMRVGPDGQHLPQIIVALTQSRPLKIDAGAESHTFRGGSTLIIDLTKVEIQYAIIKRIDSESRVNGQTREERTAAFVKEAMDDPLRRLMLAPKNEPFAALHSLSDMN
jgi:subtilisin family serine protease